MASSEVRERTDDGERVRERNLAKPEHTRAAREMNRTLEDRGRDDDVESALRAPSKSRGSYETLFVVPAPGSAAAARAARLAMLHLSRSARARSWRIWALAGAASAAAAGASLAEPPARRPSPIPSSIEACASVAPENVVSPTTSPP